MKKITLFVVICLFVVISSVWALEAPKKSVKFEVHNAKKQIVVFQHLNHSDIECTTCHHKVNNYRLKTAACKYPQAATQLLTS